MNYSIKFAIAGALLAAAPVLAAKDLVDEKSVATAEQGARHHGQDYRGHGRDHGAKMGRHGRMRGHANMHGRGLMTAFDGDGDGRLTQSEIDKSRAGRLAKFDSDGNGSLNLAEYQALWVAAMRERMVDRFQDLDADGDAVITAEEFKRPFATMVRDMDRNGDGVLTRQRRMMKEHKKQ